MPAPENIDQLVYRGYWNDHLVEIEDAGNLRSLYFGSRSLQSRMSLTTPHTLVLPYTCYMVSALLINSAPQNALIVGIGSGSFIRFIHHHFPRCRIDAVDYSPHVISAAKDHFQLPETKRISIHCADGRSFLQESGSRRYDLVLIDAFNDQGMAPTVYSDLFFSLCASSLAPDGVVSCNLWSNDRERLNEIKEIFTMYFKSCLYLPVPDRGNIIGLAMPFALPWSKICLKKKEADRLSKRFNLDVHKLIQVAKQNNLSLSKRVISWFSYP
ncbi:MAG: fused MFS/spermidine synthase [Desulforhopalus sp.]